MRRWRKVKKGRKRSKVYGYSYLQCNFHKVLSRNLHFTQAKSSLLTLVCMSYTFDKYYKTAGRASLLHESATWHKTKHGNAYSAFGTKSLIPQEFDLRSSKSTVVVT
jgi:hypothetical protein